jgi:tRNA-modifying protein YgfZ
MSIDGAADCLDSDCLEYSAARSGVALYDQSHWGCIEVTDEHRLDFLHNQSTNGFKLLKPGETCDTTFLTSTARTLDLTTALIFNDKVQLLVSPEMASKLIAFLDRFIFFSDRVKLTDCSKTIATLCLLGPNAATVLEGLGLALPESGFVTVQIADATVHLMAESGLKIPGFRLMMAVDDRDNVWNLLSKLAVVMTDRTYDRLRIEQGRPMPGFELTEDYNPLDAGLWSTISFNKGCYIGQETIARLDSRDAVKMKLWGVKLDGPVELGSTVFAGDDKAGTITSMYTNDDGSAIGLVYVRAKAGGEGLAVTIESQTTTLMDLPFPDRTKQL